MGSIVTDPIYSRWGDGWDSYLKLELQTPLRLKTDCLDGLMLIDVL